jgi:hypothetical protein
MRTRLAALCQAHGIQVLFAFGSRAREMDEHAAAMSPSKISKNFYHVDPAL